jgi:hypothetical protein
MKTSECPIFVLNDVIDYLDGCITITILLDWVEQTLRSIEDV